MWPDRVSNLGPLALESDAPPTALHNPAKMLWPGVYNYDVRQNRKFYYE